jgi:hypothetical protein
MPASASPSDRNLHLASPFRTQTYYLTLPLPQSVTDSLIETDQKGDGSGRRGNPKERMLEKGTSLISKSIPGWHLKVV